MIDPQQLIAMSVAPVKEAYLSFRGPQTNEGNRVIPSKGQAAAAGGDGGAASAAAADAAGGAAAATAAAAGAPAAVTTGGQATGHKSRKQMKKVSVIRVQ
jgi:hypothetical protein